MPSTVGIVASGFVEVASGPAFRSASTTTTATSTMTCAMPSGIASGDILVMQVYFHFDAKSGGFATAPSGWTNRGSATNSSGDGYGWYVYTKTASASEPSVTQTGLNWFCGSMSIIAVSGATAVDVAGSVAGGLVASSATTTTSTDLLVGLWGVDYSLASRPITAPASMTSRATNAASSPANSIYLTQQIATESLTATGATGTRTATTTGTTSYVFSMLLAVK